MSAWAQGQPAASDVDSAARPSMWSTSAARRSDTVIIVRRVAFSNRQDGLAGWKQQEAPATEPANVTLQLADARSVEMRAP